MNDKAELIMEAAERIDRLRDIYSEAREDR
jgi:hypothetical protein